MFKKLNFIKGKVNLLVVTFFLAILLVSFISAFGIGSSYWAGNPLKISPGDTKIVTLWLQNMVGDKDVTLKASIVNGSEIASMEKKQYTIKAKTTGNKAFVTIHIPKNVSLNSSYTVSVYFQTVTYSSGISLGTGIQKTFDVMVTNVPKTPKPKPKTNKFVWIAIVLALMIAILILIYLFRKKIFNKK